MRKIVRRLVPLSRTLCAHHPHARADLHSTDADTALKADSAPHAAHIGDHAAAAGIEGLARVHSDDIAAAAPSL